MEWNDVDLFAPTDEHRLLADTVRAFVAEEVEPQAAAFNRDERFNLALFKRCGELGLLGLTVGERFGGAGMDATAAVIVHEALSTADPAFCLSYLAHSVLFVNNLNTVGGGLPVLTGPGIINKANAAKVAALAAKGTR